MKIIQCRNHHYYDSEKYSTCPYCLREEQESNEGEGYFDEDKTISGTSIGEPEDDEATLAYDGVSGEMDRTIGIFRHPGENEYVTGWLVCIEGDKKGASYPLRFGRNFIGRSLDMDVSLSEDLSVSRKCHSEIVFDDKTVSFYIVPGAGVATVDGHIVQNPEYLREDMVIGIGKGRYRFVPYCNERRTWE